MWLRHIIEHLGNNYQIYTRDQISDLLSTRNHPSYINDHRIHLIIERVRFFSSLFAVLITLWLVIDYLVFPVELFIPITMIRLMAVVVFVYLAWPKNLKFTLVKGKLYLAFFLLNLPLTFLGTVLFIGEFPLQGISPILVKIYTLLPYLSITGLSLFPLTVMEILFFAVPLSVIAIGGWSIFHTTTLIELIPSAWLLMMLVCAVLFSSTIQLQYLNSLVSRSSFDPMTGALTHRSGLDTLVREFQQAIMHNDNFAIALIDLDNVDSIINEYDYATYDHAIIEAAIILQNGMRHNDRLVRWGEKSFMLIMPNTNEKGVQVTLGRVQNKGVSSLPDGKPVTASIGASERMKDDINDWHKMIELVDSRRDEAKSKGKDNIVFS